MNGKFFSILSALTVSFLLIPGWLVAQFNETLPPPECQTNDERIEVLLLGSYHMSNPGLDRFNLAADDVLTAKRQAEIQEIVDRLASFEPTKITIEASFNDSSTIENYHSYVDDKRDLTRNESEQIGFRLAKQLGHPEIYPIDVPMMLDDSELGPLVAANPTFQMQMGKLDQFGQGAMAQLGTWLAEGTIREMLFNMNQPEILAQAHWPYIWILATIVEGDNYAGADMVSTWYQRNLRIFANLNRVAESGDRIVLLYGQGHIPVLAEMVGASPEFCTVNPLSYLGGETK